MQRNWLIEIVKRAQSGPFIKEKDFELALVKRIRQLVKEYGIKYDAETLVPADDGMADRVFEAGLQRWQVRVALERSNRRYMERENAQVHMASTRR